VAKTAKIVIFKIFLTKMNDFFYTLTTYLLLFFI